MAAFCVNKVLFNCVSKAKQARVCVPQCNGFFSSKKPEEEKSPQKPYRALQSEEGNFTAQHNLGMLKNKVSLNTKTGYKPPANVRGLIEKLVVPFVGDKNWETASLKDPGVKYKVMTRLIKEFNRDVPNNVLNDIKSVKDAVEYFGTEVRETSTYEDLSKLDLPKNLHMQLEYLRFDPETDTMFKGRTAFPGSDTIVSSIKYKRKYKTIKTSVDKPGYANYYYKY